jgi:hypothetical protein
VAVAVETLPHMVLDEDYLIVQLGPEVEAALGPLQGRDLWEAFPDAKPLFHPYYERARDSGQAVEFVQFYNGQLARIRAVPEGATLQLFWETLDRLDTLTLEGLRESLAHAAAVLEDQDAHADQDGARGRLRLIEGGGA